MNEHGPKLGQLITGEAYKDAIHIAVAPVIAGEDLYPGREIGLAYGTSNIVLAKSSYYDQKPLGIVDPFLKGGVRKGEQFYMFLFPNTVTGMRHEWEHPAFVPTAPENESERWLRGFADKWGFNYDNMIYEAQLEDGYITACGIDLHSRAELDEGEYELFWYHIEKLTNRKFDEEHKENIGWSCSC